MYNDVEDLYNQVKMQIDYSYSIIESCERSNDREGILYHSGKLHAYSNILDCLKDLLDDTDLSIYAEVLHD